MKQQSNHFNFKHELKNVTTEKDKCENKAAFEDENFITFVKRKSFRPMKSLLKPRSLHKEASFKAKNYIKLDD